MILMALCSPSQRAELPDSNPSVMFTRVSPSTSILGRQIAVGPASQSAPPDSAPASGPWGNPSRLAYCGTGGIKSSTDGGQSWRDVPTGGVEQLAAGTDWPLAPTLDGAQACQSVTLDPDAQDTFYAVFAAVRRPQGAPPPWYPVGYVTRDAGQSWQAVPPPASVPDAQFGGFTVEAGPVQALFSPPQANTRPAGGPQAPTDALVQPPLVQQTPDGGQTWVPAEFGCPQRGNCIRWGAPPAGIGSCAMHGYLQPLLASGDGGHTWKTPRAAIGANACQPNELLEVGNRTVFLLTPGASELDPGATPFRYSNDGGQTFLPRRLPAGPDAPTPVDLFELHALPDARLLARVSGPEPGPGWHWQLAGPRDSQSAPPPASDEIQEQWCMVAESATLPHTGAPVRVVGERVWWLADDGQPRSISITELQCTATPSIEPPGQPAPSPTTAP